MNKRQMMETGSRLIKKMTKEYPYYSESEDYQADLAKYKSIVTDIELENVEDFAGKKGVADGFTATKDDTFYIMFFSSNSKKDWLFNFWVFHREIPYEGTSKKIKVHSGFITAYKACRDELAERIKASGKKKIFVTGHSLGGAISILCALDIKYNNPDFEVDSISFGSPRVGNKRFVESFNKRMSDNIRVGYGSEFTLSIPFKWMGFQHVSSEEHLGPKKRWFWSFKNHWPSNSIKEIFKK